jgi:hypothetical protein
MTLAVLVGGAAIGGISYLISLVFYLIVLFPIGMGTVGGLISGWAIKSGKVRQPLAASLCGFLTGLITYGVLHGLEYFNFAPVVRPVAIDRILPLTPKRISLFAYLQTEAKKGSGMIRLGRAGLQNMGEVGTWFYWLVELAIIPRALAAEAFCEDADDWYSEKVRFGNVEPTVADNFLELIKTPPLTVAGTLINTHIQKVEAGSLEIYTKMPLTPGDYAVLLSINATAVNDRGKLKLQEVAAGILSPPDYQQLTAAIPDPIENFASTDIIYRTHDLDADQVAAIVHQLSPNSLIQAIYLLKIVSIKGVVVIDTYQIGIIFDRQQITTEQQQQELLDELSREVEIPGEAYVTLLNNDAKSLYAIRQIVTQPVYHKQT